MRAHACAISTFAHTRDQKPCSTFRPGAGFAT